MIGCVGQNTYINHVSEKDSLEGGMIDIIHGLEIKPNLLERQWLFRVSLKLFMCVVVALTDVQTCLLHP